MVKLHSFRIELRNQNPRIRSQTRFTHVELHGVAVRAQSPSSDSSTRRCSPSETQVRAHPHRIALATRRSQQQPSAHGRYPSHRDSRCDRPHRSSSACCSRTRTSQFHPHIADSTQAGYECAHAAACARAAAHRRQSSWSEMYVRRTRCSDTAHDSASAAETRSHSPYKHPPVLRVLPIAYSARLPRSIQRMRQRVGSHVEVMIVRRLVDPNSPKHDRRMIPVPPNHPTHIVD